MQTFASTTAGHVALFRHLASFGGHIPRGKVLPWQDICLTSVNVA